MVDTREISTIDRMISFLTLRQAAMDETRSFLESIGLPPGDPSSLPDSAKRPDGAAFRIEIPSTEGPRALEAVLDEAERREVRVHRVSQGAAGSC